jgi:hypothetical protein
VARRPAEAEETLCLLRNALDGDRQAFDRLFARYRAYLHQVVELRLRVLTGNGSRGDQRASEELTEAGA